VQTQKNRNRTQIAFIGSITPIKGLEFLLDSIRRLGHLTFTLKLIGEKTDYLNFLNKKYDILFKKNIVTYCGTMGQNELIRNYSDSDFCILPSEYDQFGQVVLEAFAMGKPVIVSDRVGARVIIEEGKDGFIVPYGNIEIMSQCIEKLIVHKKIRLEMGENARHKAEKFSWYNIAEQYNDFFSNILR
jgi:glycosyltransferase involved in cell wall biosynthesis